MRYQTAPRPGVGAEFTRRFHPPRVRTSVRARRARKQALALERTTYLLDYFDSHPCADCGESDPVVLEFDHLDTQAKSFDIGQSLPYRKWQSILEEIDKCDVVCANCHRRRTARRRGSLRALLKRASAAD
jgi:hypothetical protein